MLVKKLNKEYRSRGLTENFESLDDFKNKFKKQLSSKLNDEFFKGYETKINHFEILTNDVNGRIKLSSLAKELLIEGSIDNSGQILKLDSMEDFVIETKDKELVKTENPRIKSKMGVGNTRANYVSIFKGDWTQRRNV